MDLRPSNQSFSNRPFFGAFIQSLSSQPVLSFSLPSIFRFYVLTCWSISLPSIIPLWFYLALFLPYDSSFDLFVLYFVSCLPCRVCLIHLILFVLTCLVFLVLFVFSRFFCRLCRLKCQQVLLSTNQILACLSLSFLICHVLSGVFVVAIFFLSPQLSGLFICQKKLLK